VSYETRLPYMTRMQYLTFVFVVLVGALGGCSLESSYYFPECCDIAPPEGYQDLCIKTSDGAALDAWFLPAPSLAEGRVKRAPVVIFCHGNRRTIDYAGPGLAPLGQKADVSFLFFSYRGYGRSDPCSGVTRRSTVVDARAALDAALARPDVDPSGIVMMGYSIGGVPALAVAAERPEVRAVIIGGTYSRAKLILQDRDRSLAYLFLGDDYDPAASAAHLGSRPLFLFHGLADTDIEPYHALTIGAAAMRAGTPVTLELIEGADHNGVLAGRPGLYDEIAGFIRTSLGLAPRDQMLP